MYRHTDCLAFISNTSGNGLSDPPGCICTELKSLSIIELLNSLDQTHVAFLDQIKERNAAAHILLRNTDYQTKICFNNSILGLLVSRFRSLGKLNLFLRG